MLPNDGRVVSNFIIQALRGEDITVYGDGSHTRSFCYVDDTVEAIVRMMKSPDGFTGPVNVGNPEEVTILELAKKIIDISGSSSKVVFSNLPEDDPRRRKPDIALAREKLGWNPSVGIDRGLEKTIDFFRSRLAI